MPTQVKRVWFKPYQYLVTTDDTTYQVRVLPVSSRHILTINSKYVWNIKSGTVNGLQYKTRGSHLIDMKPILALPNPVVVFKNRPYKILQYLNESDIIDISGQQVIHDLPIFTTLQSFLHQLSTK